MNIIIKNEIFTLPPNYEIWHSSESDATYISGRAHKSVNGLDEEMRRWDNLYNLLCSRFGYEELCRIGVYQCAMGLYFKGNNIPADVHIR